MEGASALVDAPALRGLSTRAATCQNYFVCGTKRKEAVVKITHNCYFKEARSADPENRGQFGACQPDPYACQAARCAGWRVCKCDKCLSVKVPFPIWCER